jgi:uncharacterized membrane protein YfcA
MNSPLEAIALFAAAFLGGAINAVVGGGSLVSFPALLAVGVPSKAAIVTNTVALWPGYASGSVAYRDELRHQGSRIVGLIVPSVLGAIVGSVILLATPESAFDAIVPFLILFAVVLMAFQSRLSAFARTHRLQAGRGDGLPAALLVSVFFLAMYGAYFGAGLGMMTLAILLILLPDDIQHSNALKGVLSFLMNAVAVVYFAFFGPVHWLAAAVMAIGAIVGGYFGVDVARKLGDKWLRRAVIIYGLITFVVLLVT